jgi:(p)ppGpp synthase/HD superfamily hydrolase
MSQFPSAYAQTNIQLYGQLFAANWADADLRRIHAAYGLAMTVFAGHFRPNGKPFLSHLVGVASILAPHGGEASVVAAGLLHSAYSHGEFGDSGRGMTSAKRRQVCRAVGDDVEALVVRYSAMRWTLSDLATMTANAGRLSAADRTVALIKLADVLEDHLERGMQFSPNKQTPGGSDADGAWRGAFERLAAALGHEQLAAELRVALDPLSTKAVPAFLQGDKPASFVIAPISHRMRTSVRINRLLRRWRVKLGAFTNRAA